VPAAARPLSAAETNLLRVCETDIYDRLDSIDKHWREIAKRLRQIRDDKLYRVEFPTFEDYVRSRWQKTAHRARQLISADQVMRELEEGPETPRSGKDQAAPVRVLPTRESQVRALVPLPKEERKRVWDEAVTNAKGVPTAREVKEVIAKGKPKPKLLPWRAPEPVGMPGNKPGPELAEIGAAIRERILEESQRAIVAVRALQDLVMGSGHLRHHCDSAVREIEKLEGKIKHSDSAPIKQEIIWAIRDSAADLGGLEEMLETSGDSGLARHAANALLALKPLNDEFKLGNMRIERLAEERKRDRANVGLAPADQVKTARVVGISANRQSQMANRKITMSRRKLSAAARALLSARLKARWARLKAKRR
jgi:hypothetical protein